MPTYKPPIEDIKFILEQIIQSDLGIDQDLIDAILHEGGRFCAEVIAPLNATADRVGCVRHPNGCVSAPPGFRDAYRQFRESGWGTLSIPEEAGGQGLSHVLSTAFEEFIHSACHAFNMYPGLTHAAVSVLLNGGSEELKAQYLPQLVSGEWLATMALTEAQAGTDLGLVRTKAEDQGDGSFRVSGEKIFCSSGEHDLTENIVHLVLARLPDAPAGSRGLSLFIVPKILPGGTRNAVSCGAIEHKMGLHGSATCVMNFDGATGWLIGQPGQGLSCMFLMMNAARLTSGNQGLAHAELAYQNAASYAKERRQGRSPGSTASADPLISYPDVRRLLLDAKAFTEGFRALVLWTAHQMDLADHQTDPAAKAAANEWVAFITPVIKAYGSDRGFETAVAMQQVFGGHGYIAEWGMEQIVRDSRVVMMYEGANAVQALDLVMRKLMADDGKVCEDFLTRIEADCLAARQQVPFLSDSLEQGVTDTRKAARWLLQRGKQAASELGAGSYAFLEMVGVISVGWMWLRLAQAASGQADEPFCKAKLMTAQHYANHTLPKASFLRIKVEAGSEALMALPEDAFGA